MLLSFFHPLIAEWFLTQIEQPTDVQRRLGRRCNRLARSMVLVQADLRIAGYRWLRSSGSN